MTRSQLRQFTVLWKLKGEQVALRWLRRFMSRVPISWNYLDMDYYDIDLIIDHLKAYPVAKGYHHVAECLFCGLERIVQ